MYNFSQRDLYPEYPYVTTNEATIPEADEEVFYETTAEGNPITTKQRLSYVGVLLFLIVLVIALGYDKKIKK